ncbi:MAG: ABC-2 type transport system permease protein [Planctomycetota bacterium]|jgi:ABC-2 type transport system permease protein
MKDLIRTTFLLFRLHISTVLRSRRALIAILLAAIAPLLAFLAIKFGGAGEHDGPGAQQIVRVISFALNLQVIVPVMALIAGSAVITEEVENRTITYVFTRPVPRPALLYGRWLSTLVLVCTLLAASNLGLLWAASTAEGELSEGLASRLVLAGCLGGAVYTMIAAILGIFLRRPMIVALGYAFAVEGVLSNLPGSTQSLSVQYYLRSILVDQSDESWREMGNMVMAVEYLTPTQATIRLLLLLSISMVIGGLAIRRKQFVLTS